MADLWWRPAVVLEMSYGLITPTNPDGRASKRVANAGFRFNERGRRGLGWRINLTADLPYREFQDEAGFRRKAAGLLYPFGLTQARRIADGRAAPQVGLFSRERGIWQIAFTADDQFEAASRHVVVAYDLITGDPDAQPEVEAGFVTTAADLLKRATQKLHGAVSGG
jgi:hypothetical protein